LPATGQVFADCVESNDAGNAATSTVIAVRCGIGAVAGQVVGVGVGRVGVLVRAGQTQQGAIGGAARRDTHATHLGCPAEQVVASGSVCGAGHPSGTAAQSRRAGRREVFGRIGAALGVAAQELGADRRQTCRVLTSPFGGRGQTRQVCVGDFAALLIAGQAQQPIIGVLDRAGGRGRGRAADRGDEAVATSAAVGLDRVGD
jgi:hypothetical protein